MKNVYLDSNVVIYYIEQHPRYLAAIQERMFGTQDADQIQYTVSDLVRMESRVHPLGAGNLSLLARFDTFFDANQAHSTPMDTTVFDLATQLRAEHKLKTPDALHLAAALNAGCDEFWTNDHRLANAAQGRINIVTFESTL